MNRNEFIKNCGYACLGLGTMGLLLEGCNSQKMINAELVGDVIRIPLSDFETRKKLHANDDIISKTSYIIAQHPKIKFPICVYRLADNTYSALYMRCSHQGAELTAFGDKLVCAAHGSEFDQYGKVQNAPADTPLRTFPTTIEHQYLIISLKAI
ncbi:MAG: Rieske (2Fe-2S) protein [Bacteroidetes bacterium]|nr:Rieske (2Fe-2S) protein [Bacteroidota bacterium]